MAIAALRVDRVDLLVKLVNPQCPDATCKKCGHFGLRLAGFCAVQAQELCTGLAQSQ